MNGAQLRAAAAVHPIAAVQNEWSLFNREQAESIAPVCAELGVTFVAYSPLGRGLLAGQVAGTAMPELSPELAKLYAEATGTA